MRITINYSSKWSNSFFSEEKNEPIIFSSQEIKQVKDKEKVIINENDTYEDIMYKINNVYPNFQYKTITKNTVLGILSRLLGEVRYLNKFIDKDENHIINKIKNKVSFKVFDREIFNEIIRISRGEDVFRESGSGILRKNPFSDLLLTNNEYSKIIYSTFNINKLQDVNDFIDVLEKSKKVDQITKFIRENNFTYNGSIESHTMKLLYNKNDQEIKIYNEKLKIYKSSDYNKDDDVESYVKMFKKMGSLNYNDPNYYLEKDKLSNISVLLIYSFFKFLDRNEYNIKGILSENGKIKGLAEKSGYLTAKDYYDNFANKKVLFNTMYMLETDKINKKENKKINQGNFKLGISKEDGVLDIFIDISEEEAIEMKRMIQCVGVSSFQLGKKGLAYVKEIDVDE